MSGYRLLDVSSLRNVIISLDYSPVRRPTGIGVRGSSNIVRYNTIVEAVGACIRIGGSEVDDVQYGIDNEVSCYMVPYDGFPFYSAHDLDNMRHLERAIYSPPY